MLLPFLFTIKIIRDTTKINLTEANIGVQSTEQMSASKVTTKVQKNNNNKKNSNRNKRI